MSVMGAMSTKFAVHAGLLIFAARVEMHSISAILEPSTPVSIASDDVLRRLDGEAGDADTVNVHKNRVIGIDHTEMPIHSVRKGAVTNAGMIFGADLLHEGPILFDFASSHLRVPERGEERGLEATMVPLPVQTTVDGCLAIETRDDADAPISVALIGAPVSDTRGETHFIRIGNGLVQTHSVVGPRCQSSAASMGWEAFAGKRILFDLPHDKLWISR